MFLCELECSSIDQSRNRNQISAPCSRHGQHNNGALNSGTPPSPLSSRHSSQDSLHKNNFSSVGLPIGQLSTSHLHMQSTMSPATAAAVAAAQKKKGIKSSLGRFFSKKEKVRDFFPLLFSYYYLEICEVLQEYALLKKIPRNFDTIQLSSRKLIYRMFRFK